MKNTVLKGVIANATARVLPRVEELVRTMYLCTSVTGEARAGVRQASLLEARAAALVICVHCLHSLYAVAVPSSTANSSQDDSPDSAEHQLAHMEVHLDALKQAALHEETLLTERCRLVFDSGGEDTAETSTTTALINGDAARPNGQAVSEPAPNRTTQEEHSV